MRLFKTIITIAFIINSIALNAQQKAMMEKMFSGKPVFEQGKNVIPFELDGQHTIMVYVTINENKKRYKFIFDTGGITAISQKVVEELDLIKGIEIPMMKNTKAYFLEPLSINLGTTKINDFIPLTFDMQQIFSLDFDGFIGSDILRFFSTTINYKNKQIYLEQSNTTEESKKNEYVAKISAPIPERHPSVEIEINGKIKINGMIDTGSPFSFVFPLSYIDEMDNSLKKQLIKSKGSIIDKWPGASSNDNYLLRIKKLKIGQLVVKNIPVVFVDLPKNTKNVLIGKDFLCNFLIKIDFPSNKIIFKPYENHNLNTNIFSTGLAVMKNKNNKTVVKGFWETSPTDNSKIKVNDEIISINGKSTSELSLKEIRNILEDSQIIDIKLEINKGNKTKTIVLKKKMLFPEIGN